MSSSRMLSLPKEFPYLGHRHLTYRLIRVSDDVVTIQRSKGQLVDVPTATVSRCHEALLASPGRTLHLQSIPAGGSGQSVVGAILVAADLAKVVGEKPIQLLGIQ